MPKPMREWTRDDGATAAWTGGTLTITTRAHGQAIEAGKKAAQKEATKIPNF